MHRIESNVATFNLLFNIRLRLFGLDVLFGLDALFGLHALFGLDVLFLYHLKKNLKKKNF
jgi:hypothetical protein